MKKSKLIQKLCSNSHYWIFLIFIFSSHQGFCQKTEPFYIEKSLPKGFVRDGSIDYTQIIQSALNNYRHIVFPNFPLLVNDSGLKVKSNTKVEFQENSSIILKPTNKESYNIFDLDYVENIDLINIRIVGDKNNHLGSKGANGNGISIRGSKHIKIINPKVDNCWGDGILIGGLKRHNVEGRYVPCEDIKINGGILNNNRRNGLSIMSVRDMLVENLTINNTKGAFPMAGIDLEPNFNKDYMEKVVLRNVVTKNNRYGIQIVLKKLVGGKKVNVDVLIDNHTDFGSQMGLRFDKMSRGGLALGGQVKIINSRWNDNKHSGITFDGSQDLSCDIVLQNVHSYKRKIEQNMNMNYLNRKIKYIK